MRKLMVTMIDLLILILLEVQANNLVSTSSYPSLSNPLPIPFELDNVKGLVYNCLDVNVAHCKKMAKNLLLSSLQNVLVCVRDNIMH